MDHPRTREIVRDAVAAAREAEPRFLEEHGSIPVAHYGEERLALERAHLFRAMPIPIAHVSEPPYVRAIDGVAIALARGADGVVHSPQARVEERHGLVWATLAPDIDVRAHLAGLDDELGALGLDRCVVGALDVAEHRGNWKLPMEGFLESYHVRTLHRATVYPFFLDARSAVERVGPHVRAATARRAARQSDVESGTPLRELATPSWTIFPCTTLIAHPDWTSLVVIQPLTADRFAWSHAQLLPEEPRTEAARAHYARSFELIQGGVFEAEDLRMASEIQAGLASGANEALLFGTLESPALWFHDAIARAIR